MLIKKFFGLAASSLIFKGYKKNSGKLREF